MVFESAGDKANDLRSTIKLNEIIQEYRQKFPLFSKKYYRPPSFPLDVKAKFKERQLAKYLGNEKFQFFYFKYSETFCR